MAGGDLIEPIWPGRIAGDVGHDRIAACLVLDIQNAAGWARVVLSHIDKVIAGDDSQWDMGMNAYMLRVRAEESEILPVYEETGEVPVTVRTADLRTALLAWIARIDATSG